MHVWNDTLPLPKLCDNKSWIKHMPCLDLEMKQNCTHLWIHFCTNSNIQLCLKSIVPFLSKLRLKSEYLLITRYHLINGLGTLGSKISVGSIFINFVTFSQHYDPYSEPNVYYINLCLGFWLDLCAVWVKSKGTGKCKFCAPYDFTLFCVLQTIVITVTEFQVRQAGEIQTRRTIFISNMCNQIHA